MTRLVLPQVAMHANEEPNWSGQQSVKRFDVGFEARDNKNVTSRFLWLEVQSTPMLYTALSVGMLNLLVLAQRPQPWEDVDQFVVTFGKVGISQPRPVLPEWPRRDSHVRTASGVVRWDAKLNLHMVFTTEMREQVTVWIDTLLERGELAG